MNRHGGTEIEQSPGDLVVMADTRMALIVSHRQSIMPYTGPTFIYIVIEEGEIEEWLVRGFNEVKLAGLVNVIRRGDDQ